jgi:hypothetical protein
VHAEAEIGRPKFEIKHVRGILLDPRCRDVVSRDRLTVIEDGLRDGYIKPNITIFEGTVIDGNKTATAYPHIHQLVPEIDLRVHVITRN